MNISNENIVKIVEEYKKTKISFNKLSKKYGVSDNIISKWVRLDENNQLNEYLLQREESKKPLGGIKKINKFEDKYNPFVTNAQISSFYRDELKIGDNVVLDFETIDKEIKKLETLLFSGEFEKEYGRKFNIIDLYLTTNLSVKDICYNYVAYMDLVTQKRFLSFCQGQIINVDNIDIFRGYNSYPRTTYLRFQRPAEKRIQKMINMEFILFNNIKICKQDIYKAYQILLDLNEKYGVKYDDISLYYVLDAYIHNYINTYYEIGEKYKAELDQVTHVQKRCIPTLTRRENIND